MSIIQILYCNTLDDLKRLLNFKDKTIIFCPAILIIKLKCLNIEFSSYAPFGLKLSSKFVKHFLGQTNVSLDFLSTIKLAWTRISRTHNI